ncbi:MAG: ABC transporter permease [Bacteroidales bacterium]
MNHLLTIVQKETLDTLRDRRTLIVMILVPVLVFPLLFIGINRLQTSVMEREQERTVRIGWVSEGPNERLAAFLDAQESMELIPVDDSGELEQLIRNDSILYGLVVPEGFETSLNAIESGTLSLFYSGAQIHGKERIDRVLKNFERMVMEQRLEEQGLTQEFIRPFQTQEVNIATDQEMIGKLAGGFLPYLFIIFCFTGAMYPAIDLFTGEKERRTLETLLTTPVSRLQILMGKMTVVTLTGIISAVLAILGLFIGFQITTGLPEFIMPVVMGILTVNFVLLLLLMLVPLTIFFAGVMVPVTIYAKTFKEAQSMLTPMTFLVIIPAALGMLPFIEYNALTALIPVVNISLATKEIIAGTIHLPHYLITVVSLIGLAALSVVFCARWFGKEHNILR